MTEPPLKATSRAGGTPPRAASATLAFERTDTFMPMNPAAPERAPPITKPMPVATSWSSAIRIASGMATMAMIRYWRFRYALAPSWTAPEISCIRSFPGDFASRRWVISAPYSTAAPAHTSAIRTP